MFEIRTTSSSAFDALHCEVRNCRAPKGRPQCKPRTHWIYDNLCEPHKLSRRDDRCLVIIFSALRKINKRAEKTNKFKRF